MNDRAQMSRYDYRNQAAHQNQREVAETIAARHILNRDTARFYSVGEASAEEWDTAIAVQLEKAGA